MNLRDEWKDEPEKEEPPELIGKALFGPDGGEFINVVSDKPLELAEDWDDIFRRFKRNPDHFEIVEDTVKQGIWQQSKRTEDGDRDVIDLYSYSARFRRKLSSAVNVSE